MALSQKFIRHAHADSFQKPIDLTTKLDTYSRNIWLKTFT